MEAFSFKNPQNMLIQLTLFQAYSLTGTLSYYNNNIGFKYLHYRDYYNLFVLNNGTSRDSFYIFHRVIIDLFVDYFVYNVYVEFIDEYGIVENIDAMCLGEVSFGHDRDFCGKRIANRTITFECLCVTRFIEVKEIDGYEVASINVTGHEAFSMLHAGCYTHQGKGGYLVKDLSQCIFDCQRRNYSLAGVKNRHCTCHNGFRGVMVKNNMCDVECLRRQICGSRHHTMLYFANYDELLQYRVSNTTAWCVHHGDYCGCQYGFGGANCDIRDCWLDNGQCGDMVCDGFHRNIFDFIGGVCRCPKGQQLRTFWHCADIDECATGAAKCDHKHDCINVPGSYKCHCKEEFIDECEGKKSPPYFLMLLGILIVIPALAMFSLKMLKMRKTLGSTAASHV